MSSFSNFAEREYEICHMNWTHHQWDIVNVAEIANVAYNEEMEYGPEDCSAKARATSPLLQNFNCTKIDGTHPLVLYKFSSQVMLHKLHHLIFEGPRCNNCAVSLGLSPLLTIQRIVEKC
jgi:hypothetical protein